MINSEETEINTMLSSQNFALIGAGQLGEMAISLWPSSIPLPSVVLDSNKSGKCCGIDIKKLQGFSINPPPIYLLSVFKIKPEDVMNIFSGLGQDMILTVYDFFEQYCPDKFSNGWRCLSLDDDKLSRIEFVRECFSDARSLAVFDAAIDWRYRRKLPPGFKCELESTKYDLRRFPVETSQYDTVIDCGAYDLSLAGYLSAAGVKVKRYVAFEPDGANYARCMESAAALDALSPEMVSIEKMALFEDEREHVFIEGGLLSSRLAPLDTENMGCDTKRLTTITLDNYAQKNHIGYKGRTLLKLHVEGAELPSLKGAENLIRTTKPDIFVNLSHDEISLLEIPRFLKEIGCYNMYLAGHSLFGEGLTLFATHFPKKVLL